MLSLLLGVFLAEQSTTLENGESGRDIDQVTTLHGRFLTEHSIGVSERLHGEWRRVGGGLAADEAAEADDFVETDKKIEHAQAADAAAKLLAEEEGAPFGLDVEEPVAIPERVEPGVDEEEEAEFQAEDAEEDGGEFFSEAGAGGLGIEFLPGFEFWIAGGGRRQLRRHRVRWRAWMTGA